MENRVHDVLWLGLRILGGCVVIFLNVSIDDHVSNVYPLRPELPCENLRKGTLTKLSNRQIQMLGSANN